MDYLFKFEGSREDAYHFMAYGYTIIRGTAILTSNPLVVQLLDSQGNQQTEPTASDIEMFMEVYG